MKTFVAETAAQWRKWLAKHHGSESEVWLIFHKHPRAQEPAGTVFAASVGMLALGETLLERWHRVHPGARAAGDRLLRGTEAWATELRPGTRAR